MADIVRMNLNDKVRVTLRPLGVKMLIDYWNSIPGHADALDIVHPDWRSGTVKMHLHEAMHVFGSECHIGMNPPSETTIEWLGGDNCSASEVSPVKEPV